METDLFPLWPLLSFPNCWHIGCSAWTASSFRIWNSSAGIPSPPLALQNWKQIDYIPCSWRWRGSIQSARTRSGADCGSDNELHIAKFRLKLKKVGKTTRSLRYDLNRSLMNYTVEVTNRFKGLDLVDTVPEELWTEVCNIVQESVNKIIPKKKKCKMAKW